MVSCATLSLMFSSAFIISLSELALCITRSGQNPSTVSVSSSQPGVSHCGGPFSRYTSLALPPLPSSSRIAVRSVGFFLLAPPVVLSLGTVANARDIRPAVRETEVVTVLTTKCRSWLYVVPSSISSNWRSACFLLAPLQRPLRLLEYLPFTWLEYRLDGRSLTSAPEAA